jgi:hypothetical protein
MEKIDEKVINTGADKLETRKLFAKKYKRK